MENIEGTGQMKDKINLKMIIPIGIGVLILLTLVIVFLVKKYMPNTQKMSLFDYFHTEKASDKVTLILEDEITDASCIYKDEKVYIDFDYVKANFNPRFYRDVNENLLLYTTPTTETTVVPGEKDYMIGRSKESKDYVMAVNDGDKLYLAADYVKECTAIDFETYNSPRRIVVTDQFDTEKDYVKADDDCTLRYKGNIKSKVLRKIKEGSDLRLLEKENKDTGFCKVMENSGIIGYIKAKDLGEIYQRMDKTDFKKEIYNHISLDGKVALVWHQVMNQTANSGISELLSTVRGINVVCPTWFKTSDNEGSVDASIASYDYVTKAHNAGVQVWGLCDDQSPDMKIGTVLGSTKSRLKLVNNLVAKAIQYDLDGINIDFEYVKEESGEDFIQFIREIGIKCRTNELVLSIDNYPLMNYNAYYNRREQANVADYVITMAYDEYTKNSETAGPVSSITYVQDAIKNVLTEVPKEQSVIGLPFYSRHWQEKTRDGEVSLSVESCSMNYAQELVNDSKQTAKWDETTGQDYLEYKEKGIVHKIWIENRKSLELKMKEVSGSEMAGYAFWKYGLQNNGVWSMIAKYTK